MLSRFRMFLNIKKGEGRPTLLLFAYLTLVFTAYIIAKSVRDALFLDQFGASSLPLLYIGVAFVIGIIVAIYIRLSFRFAQAELVSVTLLFFMLTALFLWGAIRYEWASTSVVYYIWVNIFGVIVTAQAWTLASSVLNVTQARRLFPLLCSGGVLGSMIGGAIAALIVDLTGTDNLILATPALLGLGVPIVWTLVRFYGNRKPALEEQSPEIEENSSVGSVLKVTMRTRYLRLIATLLAVSAVVTLFTDFQFKMLIQNYFQSKDAMTAFFGSFYAYVGLLSLAAQLVAGTRFFAKYGVHLALLFLPTALLGGTAALVAFPTLLWTGVFLKGSEGVIRSSIDKSTIEMLYIPVSQTLKVQVKAVIDMLIQRFSDAVGGVLLIILTQMMGLSLMGVGICNIVLLCWWMWIAHETRQEYVTATRQPTPIPNIEAPPAELGQPAPSSN